MEGANTVSQLLHNQSSDLHPSETVEYVNVLAQVNNFDLQSLTVNRQGQLSLPQRRTIRRRLYPTIGVLIVITLLTVGTILLRSLLGIVILINLVFGYMRLFASGLWAVLDLLEPRIIAVEGTLSRDIEVSRYKHRFWSRYFYYIANLRFEVSAEAYNALSHDIRCRLYYLVSSETILSIQLLPSANSVPTIRD